MKKHLFYSSIIISLCVFSACEKVIDINVNNATPRIIFEGIITDEAGLLTHKILMSKTTNFNSSNERIPAVGAFVTVTDISANIIDTLKELIPGEYSTQKIAGIQGHQYSLVATLNGNTYTAQSTMPTVVPFDSLYTKTFNFFGNIANQFFPVYTDPIGVENFYRFSIKVNDSLINSFDAWDDLLSDGKTNSRPLIAGDEDRFKGNDTVTIIMNCTDKGMFNFFNTLENGSGGSTTPANPQGNISNGALGYFGAITVRSRKVFVP